MQVKFKLKFQAAQSVDGSNIWFLPIEGSTRHVAKILKTNSEKWQEVCILKVLLIFHFMFGLGGQFYRGA